MLGELCLLVVTMGQTAALGMDEECLRSIQESKTLAGIFQSVVEDCKVRESSFFVSTVSTLLDLFHKAIH